MLGGEVVYEGNLFTLLSMATNYCDAQLATNRHRSLRIWYKDPSLAMFCSKQAWVLQRQQISPADMHHQALASSQARPEASHKAGLLSLPESQVWSCESKG